MEKTYKRVPFDIKLAKKIQSGEVEGRIVTENGRGVRIICFNRDSIFSMVALVQQSVYGGGENTISYLPSGKENLRKSSNSDLFIELPDETSKHEFKVGDKVRIICGMYAGRYGTIGKMVYHELTNKARVDISAVIQPYLPCEYLEKCEEPSNDRKHEFKPFDKVLVRANGFDKWKANFFSHMDDGYYKCVNSRYKECVLFKGNEDLVGTTDNPE